MDIIRSQYAQQWSGAGAVPGKGFEPSDMLFNPDAAYQDIKYINGFHVGQSNGYNAFNNDEFSKAPVNPSSEILPFRITPLPRDGGFYLGGTDPDYMWTEEPDKGPFAFAGNWLFK